MNWKFKFLGNYDIDNLLKLVNIYTTDDWNNWTLKQDTYPRTHGEGKIIPLLKNRTYGQRSDIRGQETEYFQKFSNEINSITEHIEKSYGKKLSIIHTELALLPSGNKVNIHRDMGGELTTPVKNPRIHLPIITNDSVIFDIDGERKVMKAGELWEINNLELHSVYNNGKEDRIHLILDYKWKNTNLI